MAGPAKDFAAPLFDHLFSVGDDGKYKPGLALSWDTSKDGKAITFKLRQGVYFHDGTPFNAQAAKSNIDNLIPPKATILTGIASVDVLDEYTVRINLPAFNSPSLFFGGMAGSRIPVAVAHGEGYAEFADADALAAVQPLVAMNALSQRDLDDAIGEEKTAAAAVDSAKANVYQAELNLSYTRITTPVAGVSSFASVNVGSYVDQANSLLTYVAPLDPMYVNFSISENVLLKFTADEAKGLVRGPEDKLYMVEVVLADGTVFDQKGRITFQNPNYDLETGTFLVRATLSNPKGTLRPGQFVRVRVLGVIRLNAILVPQKAVLQGAEGHFVVLVDKDISNVFSNIIHNL